MARWLSIAIVVEAAAMMRPGVGALIAIAIISGQLYILHALILRERR